MEENNSYRVHNFEFPGHTGRVSIELENGCFPDISDDELYSIGKIVRNFLSGLFYENHEARDNYLNIFHSVLKDTSIFIEDRELNTLLRFSNSAFHHGDYRNSLFLSQLVLARINQIIDKKIAINDRMIDKEIIHLQISTLNFMGYIFSKINKNIGYGLKLAMIANRLLDGFNQGDDETKSLRAAIYDTLGALHIAKENWDEAIKSLSSAHEYDSELLMRGHVDEIGFRLTCSNLGYALVNKCKKLIENEGGNLSINDIEKDLEWAKKLFIKVKVDTTPVVPEKSLKDLELLSAIRRMKKGLDLCEEVRKKLQKRFI